MAKGKLILICQSGGEFVTNEDGTMSYKGGEANAANITSETPFNDLKLNLAETCDLNQDTLNVKYFLPGNKRNLITVKNDKDLKRMIEFHGDAITAEVFVSGTPGFNHMKNDEAVDDENIEQVKAGPKKNKKPKKEDKVVKSPIVTPARTPRRSAAAAKIDASKEKEIPKRKPKQKTVSSDDSKSEGSTSDSEQDNVTVDSDISSDYVPSRYSKRKTVNTSPADGVKKRRRTPTWKIGADGRPTIVSGYVGSNSRGSSGNEKSQRKSGRLAAKRVDFHEHDDFAGPSSDDDMSPETLVSSWKSAVTGAGQQFTDVHEFQETLQKYAIANDFDFKLRRNDKSRVVGECSSEGCSWKFNAVWVPSTESFKIQTMNNVHTCDKQSKNSLLDTIKEKLRDSPHLKPKEIAKGLLKRLESKSKSNHTQVIPGTVISREQFHGSDKDAYNKLPWFCEKIKVTNPGSIANLVIDENKRFKALFVSFYASLWGFQNGCRPLLFLEATSLRSKYGEVLITANAIDGNDEFFLVAFAIVDVEDDNNWRWFLEQLKAAIVNTQQPITFVFDREKNLKPYIVEVFQDSHIGYSIYHLLESFKRNVKGPFHGDGKSFLPAYLLDAAHAIRPAGFKKLTEQMKQISAGAYDWVMQIEPQHWTASSFKGERYNYIKDDVSEPISKLMKDYRELPILHKIDAIIRTMIDGIDDAKFDGSMWSTHLTPSKEKQLQEEIAKSRGLKVLISSDTLFEVREDLTHVVNIGNWSCTCLGWKETGLPCRHALAVCTATGKNMYEFCSNDFTVDAYRLTYVESITPVPIDKDEGENEQDLKVLTAGGEKEQTLKVETAGGENEQALKVGGGNEEVGEKVEVVDEKGEEKMEIEVEVETTGGENEEGGKIEDEKEEVEITGGENEEGGKMEGQKEEVEKDEGVFVLPPIPAKPVDVMEEKMDWDETDMETKRTVTCTKCKQPGHNKKSCDMYQAPQAC
ncbi:putative transcription factor interactor and regulator CCHC(Zn) family [Helianthus annuus]|uniref:Transcription factor interactor and regulator CCHC(Zn) family n=2 Tax=Helianthus annuus TaxID=4232 RepID=A0A9K3N630_HELAN|nr:uncharacterized protein LOC110886636 [Helianthus annuus]KAF5788209.1 putative transcription factor interactor and regulator CCHC(Zn) family [Helianthus annuus]